MHGETRPGAGAMPSDGRPLAAVQGSPEGSVLRVLGGLSLTCGAVPVAVPAGSRRLLAYLA